MLQSLKLDASSASGKPREKPEDPSSSDPGFSGMLALLAGTAQASVTPPQAPPPIQAKCNSQSDSQTSSSAIETKLANGSGVPQAPSAVDPSGNGSSVANTGASNSPKEVLPTSTASISPPLPIEAQTDPPLLPFATFNVQTTVPLAPGVPTSVNATTSADIHLSASASAPSNAAITMMPMTHAQEIASVPMNAQLTLRISSATNPAVLPDTRVPAGLSAATSPNISPVVDQTPSVVPMMSALLPSATVTVQTGSPSLKVMSDQTTSASEPKIHALTTSTSALKTPLISDSNVVPIVSTDVHLQTSASGDLKGNHQHEDASANAKEAIPLIGTVETKATASTQSETVSQSLVVTSLQPTGERESITSGGDGQKRSLLPTGDATISPLQIPRLQITSAVSATPAQSPSAAIFSQVEGSIHWMLRSQEKGAELQLHPENLGRITISLKVEGTEVHAQVWASETSTLTVLQDHRAALQQSLQQQGLSLGSFDLHSGNRGEDARSGGQSLPPIAVPETLKEIESVQDVPKANNVFLPNAHRIELYA